MAAESKLLEMVGTLKQRISDLESGKPDRDGLRLIDNQTDLAINQIADVLDSQIDDAGEARLTELANALADHHADAATALVRLQDVLDEGRGEEQQKAISQEKEPIERQEPAALETSSQAAGPEQTIVMPPPSDGIKAEAKAPTQIH